MASILIESIPFLCKRSRPPTQRTLTLTCIFLLDPHCLELPAYHMLIFQALLLEFKRPQDHSPRPLSLHPHGWMSTVRCLGSIPRFVASPWSCTWASKVFHAWNAPEAITLVQGSSLHRLRHPGPDPSGFPRDLLSVYHWDVGIAVGLGPQGRDRPRFRLGVVPIRVDFETGL